MSQLLLICLRFSILSYPYPSRACKPLCMVISIQLPNTTRSLRLSLEVQLPWSQFSWLPSSEEMVTLAVAYSDCVHVRRDPTDSNYLK